MASNIAELVAGNVFIFLLLAVNQGRRTHACARTEQELEVGKASLRPWRTDHSEPAYSHRRLIEK